MILLQGTQSPEVGGQSPTRPEEKDRLAVLVRAQAEPRGSARVSPRQAGICPRSSARRLQAARLHITVAAPGHHGREAPPGACYLTPPRSHHDTPRPLCGSLRLPRKDAPPPRPFSHLTAGPRGRRVPASPRASAPSRALPGTASQRSCFTGPRRRPRSRAGASSVRGTVERSPSADASGLGPPTPPCRQRGNART